MMCTIVVLLVYFVVLFVYTLVLDVWGGGTVGDHSC